MSAEPQSENSTSSTNSTPTKKSGLSIASWIAILLLLGALGMGGYVWSFWLEFNSKTAALKAKGGDFRQLQLEVPDPEKDTRTYFKKFMDNVTPSPIQVIYWKNKVFTDEDATLMTRFTDAEIVVVSSDAINDSSIQVLLKLPKLTRMRILGMESIGTEEISKWAPPASIKNITLANPKWSRADIKDILGRSKDNKVVDDCLEVTSSIGPSAAGG